MQPTENTGWEAALEIAIEWDKNVNRLIDAVIQKDYLTADSLAKELKDDEEMLGTLKGLNGGAGH